MNIKKILAGSLAAITAGATLAFGAFGAGLGDYVTTSDGTLTSPMIVVGDTVPGSDVIGAADIAAAVAGYATTTSTVGAAGVVSVGNGADLSTKATKLYLGSALTAAKDTLTSDDLSLLADDKVTDTTGKDYKYSQYLYLGDTATVKFDVSGTSLSVAEPIIDLGSTSSSATLYNATVVFSTDLNVSGTRTDGKVITLFGQDYTLGSGSETTNTTLTLYGGGTAVTIAMGETADVTIGGTTYSIEIVGIASDGDPAYISVDGGETVEAAQGSYVTLSPGVTAYVKTVALFGTGATGAVTLRVGTDKVQLKNSDYVRTGSDLEYVKGTWVTITGGGAGLISSIAVQIYKPDTANDIITEGAAFTDPVFGTFKVAFGGLEPTLDAATRNIISVEASGSYTGSLKMTDYKDVEKTIEFASNYYPAGSAGTTAYPRTSNNYSVVLMEGASIPLNSYFTVNPDTGTSRPGFSHMLQFSNADIASATTTKTLTLQDVFSGDSVIVTMSGGDPADTGTKVIDGKTYTFTIVDSTDGAEIVNVTDTTSGFALWPTLVGANGEEIAIAYQQALTNATTYILPTGSLAYVGYTMNDTVQVVGGVPYNISATGTIYPTNSDDNTTITDPAVIIREEKDINTVRNVIVVPISAADIGGVNSIKVWSAYLTASTTSGWSKTADINIKKNLDYYGTLVSRERTSGTQGLVTVSYPDDQVTASVGIGADPTFTTAGGGTVEVAIKITSPVAKFAHEVNEDAPGADLILVGGPCANTLVETLLAAEWNVSNACSDWVGGRYTSGQGIIKEITDGFTDGSKALIVAGTNAADTRALAARVMTGTTSYSGTA